MLRGHVSAPFVSASPLVRSARRDRPLFAFAAILVLTTVFAGFAQTFYLKAWFDAPPLSNLLLAHGLVMSAWLALFVGQIALVESGRVDLHRKLGVAGVAGGSAGRRWRRSRA